MFVSSLYSSGMLYSVPGGTATKIGAVMATASSPAIAVLARSKYCGEALALSMAAHTDQEIVPLIEAESSVLARSSTIVVELDANLESALKLIRDVATQHPDSVVVVLGLLESEESIVKLAEAGACGYVSASSSFREMISIVQSARKGEFNCSPHIAHVLFSRLAALARNRNLSLLQASGLTTRERQIIEFLAQDFSNQEIADHLSIAKCTVKNHVHHLLRKLGVPSRSLAGRMPGRMPRDPLLVTRLPSPQPYQPRPVDGASGTVLAPSWNPRKRSA